LLFEKDLLFCACAYNSLFDLTFFRVFSYDRFAFLVVLNFCFLVWLFLTFELVLYFITVRCFLISLG
jgi:hypothetical protein